MRIYALSDLHTDFKENLSLLERVPADIYKESVLIVAGDIADTFESIGNTLRLLRSKFLRIFYVPGNHELWVRQEASDSVEKFFRILELCDILNIQTKPAKVEDRWIVPLFSWYAPGFDANESGDDSELKDWADFHFCNWRESIGKVSEFFLKMNEPNIKPYDGPVISFSHFLPRRDLLPATEKLKFKNLPKVAGCLALEDQIRRLRSSVHVFGHSHINCDRVIDGVRYVQNALRYPRERARSSFVFKMI
jgi:hypothetical protein